MAKKMLKHETRNDFGALIAQQDLSPLWITGKDTAADALLATALQSTRPTDYAAWVVDKTAATPSTFTDQWITDRSAMLAALVIRNQTDAQGILPGSSNIHYSDAASNTDILVGAGGDGQRIQMLFGGAGADTLNGQGYGGHLYGEAGSHHIESPGCNDALIRAAMADQIDGCLCVRTARPCRYDKKGSCCRDDLLCCRSKKHVNTRLQGVQA